MEKDLEVHTIAKIDVLRGYLSFNPSVIKKDLEKFSNKKLGQNPEYTSYEDSFCPPLPIVEKISKEIISSFEKATNFSLEKTDYWCHIHQKNMSTNTHNHHPAHISAVCYVSVPEGAGKIVFLPQTSNCEDPPSISYEPKVGQFLIFPGYLDHFVTRNHSEETRISVSFNYKLLQRIVK